MPLFRRGAPRQTRPLVASASHIKIGDRTEAERLRRLRQGWQSDAWAYRDSIGEIRYPTEFMSNAVTRMRIYPALMVAPDQPPVKLDEADGVPADLVQATLDDLEILGRGQHGLRPILSGQYVNNKIAGEMYLVGRVNEDDEEEWTVRSTDEVVFDSAGNAWIRDDPAASLATDDLIPLPVDSYVARMWTPHKRFRALADSPMRAILDRCEELLLLSRTIRGDARSRLGGAGLLILAQELSMLGVNPDSDDPESDPFFEELTRAMLTPISDEADASAVVPIVARVPGEFIKEGKAAQHLDFARPFAERAIELRAELIGRIANGLDLPPEVVTGKAELNHWSAWNVDDDTFRHHIEPDVITQVDELTAAYVQPMLTARDTWPAELVRRVCYWYDPVELVTHPDRGADAQQAFDRGAIGRETLRDVTGFGDNDKPDVVDRVLYILGKARGAPPEVVTALVKFEAPELDMDLAAATAELDGPPPAAADVPAVSVPAQRDEPADLPPGPNPPDGTTAPTTAAATVPAPAGDREPRGVMVAFYPTAEQAQALALDGGETADAIHVTLAYLGHVEDLTDAQVQALHDTCAAAAGNCAPLDGEFGGIGRFTADGSDDGDPVFAAVDVPGLGSLRDAVCQQLAAAGLPLAGEHGFTPHATLAYIDPADPMPTHRLDPVPATFAALSLVVGADRTDYPLTGADRPLVAATPAQDRTVHHGASRDLLDLDRDLRARLLTAADAAMRRQLERAAARLRSRAQRDPVLRAALSTVTADRVAVTLGHAQVAALGVTDIDLIDADWTDLAAKWDAWVARAQRRARELAARIVGLSSTDEPVAALAAVQDGARTAGWEKLTSALTSLAFTRLYDPHPDAPATGEFDPNLTVPPALVRAALAVAGSDPAVRDLAGQAAVDLPAGTFGIGSGDAVTAFLEQNGAERQHYTWVHGDTDRPLDAHVALSGYEFDSWADPGLVNNDTFPEVDVLAPSDHDGCTCDAWITWAAATGEVPIAAAGNRPRDVGH